MSVSFKSVSWTNHRLLPWQILFYQALILLIFNMVCGTVCVCLQFSYRRNDMIFCIQFSYCPLSRVLHVTLANWQRFGFEFHLRSSPSAFSGYMDISRPADYFITCYTMPTRPNKVETAVHGCNSWLSVWTLSCCPVKLST